MNISRFSNLTNILNCYTDKSLNDSINIVINGTDKDITFNLDGHNNEIVRDDFRIICYNLNIKNVKVQPSNLNNTCIVGNKYSAVSFNSDYNCKLRYENCEFINCTFSSNNNIEFIDCKFINCIVYAGIEASQYVNDNNAHIFVKVENCEFHYGEKNTNNNELIHIGFIGWKGNAIINNCRFYNEINIPEGKSLNDWIDLYDSCNVSITNCYFYSKHCPDREGIINVKSHSYSSTDGDGINDWNFTDTIGIKTNTIISNNIFVLDLKNDSNIFNDSSFIWIRNERRNTTIDGDLFNTRKSIAVSNNTFNIRANNIIDLSNIRIHLLYTSQGIENVLVMNNILHIDKNVNNSNVDIWGYFPIRVKDVDNIPEVINACFLNNIIQSNSDTVYLRLFIFIGLNGEENLDNIKIVVFKNNILYGNVEDTYNIYSEQIEDFIIKDNLYKSTKTDTLFGKFFVDDKYQVPKLELGKIVWNKYKNKLGIYIKRDDTDFPLLVNADGINLDVLNTGTFSQKPTASQGIPVGFQYFCTDKQTTEGATNGIMIYHKGGDIWVDALGRVIQ